MVRGVAEDCCLGRIRLRHLHGEGAVVIVVVAIVVVVICVGAVVVALAEDLLHVTVGAEASLPIQLPRSPRRPHPSPYLP